MFNECGYVIFLLLVIPYIESGTLSSPPEPEFEARRLSEYVSHYEPLSYDADLVHKAHLRVRRSISRERPQGEHVQIQFHAHGRHFKLRLRRDTDTFHDRLRIDGPDGNEIHIDTAHIYQGHLTDDSNSYVFGSVIDGVFEGKIVSSDDSFYVEKAHHYFPKDQHTNQSFHSVIYNEKHVNDPHLHKRKHSSGCGVTDDMVQWMDRIANSAVDDDNIDESKLTEQNRIKNTLPEKVNEEHKQEQIIPNNLRNSFENPYEKYSREANSDNSSSHQRHKRATPKENKRNTCSLFIQTDPLIWKHIREGFPDHRDPNKRLEIDEKTREEILSLIAHHVTAVNYIYRDTKFDGKIEHRNIKFEVQRIKIDDDSACGGYPYRGESNPFCMENIDVSNFLNLHSLGNHEDFCLAYVFTYRDFTGGTLGLAWVASASGASGGICEKYKTYTETVGGTYQSTKRSLNTGIITFVNYNSRVPPKVSQLTLAHEIGHNFGSPHDYPPECRPGGLNGNFIMFASATSGDRPNNSKFSLCSVGNISAVLDAIEDNKKRNCFTASEGAFCGNKIVEAGEECDCGYDDLECSDKCCYPRVVSEVEKMKNDSAKGCHRKYGTQCSPSQGPCCQSSCHFVPASAYSVCKGASDCSYSSKCDGKSPECPPPLPVADKTRCNNGTQLCIKGDCAGSICLEWNLTECFLTSNIIPNINKRKLCELACQNGTDPQSCKSTSEFAHLVGLPPGGISLRPGSPCDNFQGYCDVFFKCRAVDAEGPLVRLKNLLFNKETLLTVAQWVTEFWWAVVLMGVAFIIFMGAFIKCCAVHTPSSNPKKPPARRISETLRRPMNTLRRMHRHHHHHHHPPSGPTPMPRNSSSSGHRGRGDGASRPSASRAPPHGYGEGRGQYYPPKASAPLPANYSRSNHPELYAGAYEMHRQNQHKV